MELPADAPADRARLQALARADEFLLAWLPTQRGFMLCILHRRTAPGMGGSVFFSEELGFDVVIGEIG
ncbi:MAG: hypothetical protein ACLSHC_14525 [Bilophila wadsworthia]